MVPSDAAEAVLQSGMFLGSRVGVTALGKELPPYFGVTD